MAEQITWARCGRNHIQISLGDKPGETTFRAACALRRALEADTSDIVRDYVVGPLSVLVYFNARNDFNLKEWANRLTEAARRGQSSRRREHRKRLRIRYTGPDLNRLAKTLEISPEELVETHLKRTYEVYSTGGSPGFAYLSGLDKRLHAAPPARTRARIKAGSVAVAGPECFVFGLSQAGSCYVIAETEEPPFDTERESPFLLESCDLVRFTTAEEAAAKEED